MPPCAIGSSTILRRNYRPANGAKVGADNTPIPPRHSGDIVSGDTCTVMLPAVGKTLPFPPDVRSWRSTSGSSWISLAKELPIPAPNSGGVASGKFVARVPKTVHARLATRAKAEGVSLNALVFTFIADGLGRKERRA